MSDFICKHCGSDNYPHESREFMPIVTKTVAIRWSKWEYWLGFWPWLNDIDYKVFITEKMTMKDVIDEVCRVFRLNVQKVIVTFFDSKNVEINNVKKFEHQELYYVRVVDWKLL